MGGERNPFFVKKNPSKNVNGSPINDVIPLWGSGYIILRQQWQKKLWHKRETDHNHVLYYVHDDIFRQPQEAIQTKFYYLNMSRSFTFQEPSLSQDSK